MVNFLVQSIFKKIQSTKKNIIKQQCSTPNSSRSWKKKRLSFHNVRYKLAKCVTFLNETRVWSRASPLRFRRAAKTYISTWRWRCVVHLFRVNLQASSLLWASGYFCNEKEERATPKYARGSRRYIDARGKVEGIGE